VLGFFTFRAGVLFCPLWDKGVMAGGMLHLWDDSRSETG